MNGLKTNDLKRTLLDIDEETLLKLGKPEQPYDIVIVGGSALLLSRLTNRPMTQDIDMVEYDSRLKGILARHPEMNSAASSTKAIYPMDGLTGWSPLICRPWRYVTSCQAPKT